jgi:hypothetical protein
MRGALKKRNGPSTTDVDGPLAFTVNVTILVSQCMPSINSENSLQLYQALNISLRLWHSNLKHEANDERCFLKQQVEDHSKA